MKNVFIIGSKGIPAKYGGFETFVDYLTKNKIKNNIKYHVSCMSDSNSEFEYNGARCFNVKVPEIGSAKAVLYDLLSMQQCIQYIDQNKIQSAIVYVLACRIGPFFSVYKNKLEKLGAKVFVNPDGHEWKRSKWNTAIKKYWKYSERLMVKHADLLVCDSRGIVTYIQQEYNSYKPNTIFIAYGADVEPSILKTTDSKLLDWHKKFELSLKQYYLVVGRFVPENNYELMIREFMKSSTPKDFVIISNVEQNKFFEALQERTNFKSDPRIKFVGTVYDQELLKKIRENAFGYFHGHEVGGTNPSLLEALASTDLNLLLDVVFNNEVGLDGAVYFTKDSGSLANLINEVELYSEDKIRNLGIKAKSRIENEYSWNKIVNEYEELFLKN